MIGYQRPGVTTGMRLLEDNRETAAKIIPITIVSKDNASVYSSADDVVQGAGSIDTGLSGHVQMIGTKLKNERASLGVLGALMNRK